MDVSQAKVEVAQALRDPSNDRRLTDSTSGVLSESSVPSNSELLTASWHDHAARKQKLLEMGCQINYLNFFEFSALKDSPQGDHITDPLPYCTTQQHIVCCNY